MTYYKDLREYINTLQKHDKLVRIKRQINKDTELQPLVALQFRGLPEEERKAFLFENVVDSRGKKYRTGVAMGALAGSGSIYALGMKCKPEEISEKWAQAEAHPVKPVMVDNSPVYEEVHVGDNLLEHGGLDEFPIPIATPGFDPAPFFSAPCWISKDPETGIQNVGTYRVHVKSPTRTGIFLHHPEQHIGIHWNKCRKLGIPLQAAIAIGGPPCITYTSVSKVAYGIDELDVAGGIAGEPIKVTRARTVDLNVPAYAEIIVEGEMSMNEGEPEAPFGEFHGYMGPMEHNMPYFTVKCIAHRKDPIWLAIRGQFPPSENTKIAQIAREAAITNKLKSMNIKSVRSVAVHESSGACNFIVIQMEKPQHSEIMPALEAASRTITLNKICVAVDMDINPWDAVAVNWAIATRIDPKRDTKIIPYPAAKTDFSNEPIPSMMERDIRFEGPLEAHRLLIDATMKWQYPPISMPKKEFMEKALKIWEEEKLPKLNLQEPWWGYNLGYWSEEDERRAKLATEGKYYETGEIIAKQRKKLD